MADAHFDVLFAGAGLSAGLTAYRLAQKHPSLRIALVERGRSLGGNHTWSCHATDVSPSQLEWLDPFIVHRWGSQQVAFPDLSRQLSTGYQSLTAARFDKVLRSTSGITVIDAAEIIGLDAKSAQLADGRSFTATTVFDARGPLASSAMTLGFQKFLGLEVEFAGPHGLKAPIIMDATVPQTDGYRFVYVLPFTDRTALIEDTYYADGHDLPIGQLREEIGRYATAKGWTITQTIREEQGILPIVLEGDIDAYWADLPLNGPAPIGLRAGLFHPVTGYSLGDAVRLADVIAAAPPADTAIARALVEAHAREQWARHGFYRLLNRMLFRAAKPEERYIVLKRFYGLPEGLVERFYAGRSTLGDKARVLAGKPPVPLGAAFRALPGRRPATQVQEGLLG